MWAFCISNVTRGFLKKGEDAARIYGPLNEMIGILSSCSKINDVPFSDVMGMGVSVTHFVKTIHIKGDVYRC